MVANMEKRDNNGLRLRAISMHSVRTSIEYNQIMDTARKGHIFAAVSTLK